jgi:NhaC family Na+:H+ antiporter
MKIGPHISLFLGALVATLAALYLRNKWDDIQREITRVVSECIIVFLILMIIGMMIGVWMIGGTVPALMYYGLTMCSPGILLPLTFVFCAITSLFTGTSFGTMATMGLAFVGVAHGLGIPPHIVAGAAVAGAYFGDKMSPLSDTTLMTAGLTNTSVFDHIFSMLYTTVIPTLMCVGIYWAIGARYAGGTLDDSNIVVITSGLTAQFNITPWALVPAVLVLLLSAMKKPAVPSLTFCLIISVILAMVLQGRGFLETMGAAFSGYRSTTGVAMVDTLLTRGGLMMMASIILLIMMGCMLGGTLSQSGVFEVFVQGLFKFIKKPAHLVVGTMIYSYTILLMSGNQVLGIILGSRTFHGAYKEMDINSKVLSRTLEDTNTIAAPLVPWSTASIYACSVMGVTTAYIPYALLAFIVPFFSVFCCYSGWGMWRADGTPMWGKKAG